MFLSPNFLISLAVSEDNDPATGYEAVALITELIAKQLQRVHQK
nr:hypothetical protein [Mycoplasmopsis bovis]